MENKLDKILKYPVLERIATISIIIITVIGTYNAIARYIGRYFNLSLTSNMLLELQWYIFSAIFLLGASYTFNHDKHIRVDVIYSKRFSDRTKRIVNCIGTTLFLIPFCFILTFFSWKYFYSSYTGLEQSPDPNGLPRYLVKALMPISFLILMIKAIIYLIKNIYHIRK